MKAEAFRLLPGTDLKRELERLIREHGLQAAIILTCVGSLSKATLRMAGAYAGKEDIRAYEEELEIVSAVGTLSGEGLHVHIALSRTDGTCIGGHLKEGCIIKTTAEVVIGEIPNTKFRRQQDEQTGFPELIVEK
jgi:predicted DNA-binding protein with PD1-like motif